MILIFQLLNKRPLIVCSDDTHNLYGTFPYELTNYTVTIIIFIMVTNKNILQRKL